jgi:hypothetical protein
MSQGIFKSLEKIEDMIQSITPKTDSHHGVGGRGLLLNFESAMTSPTIKASSKE